MTSDWCGNLRKMRDNALRVLASRLWARQNGVERSDALVATYELPDGEEYPHDLTPYRSPPNTQVQP